MGDQAPWVVEEQGGDRYPNLGTVQRGALELIAGELTKVLQELLDQGVLLHQDGIISVNSGWDPAGD